MPPLRDASELLYPHVYATVMSLDIDRDGKDAGMAKLALRMARVIDDTSDAKQASALWHLGSELHKVLESLGASPAARAAMTKKTPGSGKDDRVSKLDQLREQRAKRA